MILSFFTSVTAVASMTATCIGENRSEVLEFVVDGVDGLSLTKVTEPLGADIISIIPGLDDEQYLAVDENEIDQLTRPGSSLAKLTYRVWLGNYGYTVKIPTALAQGDLPRSPVFTIDYKFVYDDILQVEISRALACGMKAKI